MSRSFAFAVGALGVTILVPALCLELATSLAACSTTPLDPVPEPLDGSATPRRDAAPVDPVEAGFGGNNPDAGTTPTASCDRYCDLVTTNCTGEHAQYASRGDCLAFCEHLKLNRPAREADEKEAASVACRQYWADSPARTNPKSACLAAGPFGGNVCGDRCTTFCEVILSACPPGPWAGAPYASQPECASACANFTYRDAGTDGGGEGPSGPSTGDSLNCRLYHLRQATVNPAKCVLLDPQQGNEACK